MVNEWWMGWALCALPQNIHLRETCVIFTSEVQHTYGTYGVHRGRLTLPGVRRKYRQAFNMLWKLCTGELTVLLKKTNCDIEKFGLASYRSMRKNALVGCTSYTLPLP
jgi:hypothetical protein